MWKRLLWSAALVNVSLGAWAAAPARTAESYPSKPIRLMVGFPPGGIDDFISRTIGAKLTERLGQTVIVDNRAGAAGNLCAEIAARANPDGHTLLIIGSITTASSHTLYP